MKNLEGDGFYNVKSTTITITSLTETYTTKYDYTTTIGELKERLAISTGVPSAQQEITPDTSNEWFNCCLMKKIMKCFTYQQPNRILPDTQKISTIVKQFSTTHFKLVLKKDLDHIVIEKES